MLAQVNLYIGSVFYKVISNNLTFIFIFLGWEHSKSVQATRGKQWLPEIHKILSFIYTLPTIYSLLSYILTIRFTNVFFSQMLRYSYKLITSEWKIVTFFNSEIREILTFDSLAHSSKTVTILPAIRKRSFSKSCLKSWSML